MRGISKTMLRTCAGLAVAAGLVVGGAGVASAATTNTAAHATSSDGAHCNPFARQQWNLNGHNQVLAVFQGNTFTYSVKFKQAGGCLGGTLTDPYFGSSGTTGPISGAVFKDDHVTFSFTYPAGSVQGTRTFTGTIDRHGDLSGTWSETGTENASGTFTLAKDVHRACPPWFPFKAECRVFP